MLCASLVTSAGNRVFAVSRITCRTGVLAVGHIALRLIITTSTQDDSVVSARTTAAPTCPVPPAIKTRNAIAVEPFGANFSTRPLGAGRNPPIGQDEKHGVLVLPRRRDEHLLRG